MEKHGVHSVILFAKIGKDGSNHFDEMALPKWASSYFLGKEKVGDDGEKKNLDKPEGYFFKEAFGKVFKAGKLNIF